MRSYNDIVWDVKNGVPVTHKETIYAIQAADALLFFKKKDIQNIIEADSDDKSGAIDKTKLWIDRAKKSLEIDYKSVNLPIDQYLGESAVDEHPKGSTELDEAKKFQSDISAAFSADKFDPKKVLGLWAKRELGH